MLAVSQFSTIDLTVFDPRY